MLGYLSRLINMSRYVHWRDSKFDLLNHVRTCGVTYKKFTLCALPWLASTAAPVVPYRFSHVKTVGMTHAQVMLYKVARLNHTEWSDTYFSFFLLLSRLFGCDGSIGDSWIFSSIRSPWCPKSPPWVGIPVLLGIYVVSTVSFGCILKVSFGWTHVIGFQN
jgi:hypothetical protein